MQDLHAVTGGSARPVGSMHVMHPTGAEMHGMHRHDELVVAEGQDMQDLHEAETGR